VSSITLLQNRASTEARGSRRTVRRPFKILLFASLVAGLFTVQSSGTVSADQESSSTTSRVALVQRASVPPRTALSATPPSIQTGLSALHLLISSPSFKKHIPIEKAKASLEIVRQSTSWISNSLWSGYVARAHRFTGVSGEWTVPKVKCNSTIGAWASQWIGIGGYNDPRLIQVGTDTDCLGGQATYYAWYEYHSVPGDAVGFKEILPSPTLYVLHAGDVMSAWISLRKNRVVVLSDLTAHWTFRMPIRPVINFGAAGSAEWVTEDEPGINGVSQGRLPNFANVHFVDATATVPGHSAPLSSFRRIGINLVYRGHRLVVTSSLDSSGSSFSQRWIAAI
jgi:hypothetical protein